MEKKDTQNANMAIYNKVKDVPDNAKKSIQAGRLKGKSDINPMWRIKMLTEIFGPAGLGWYTEIVNKWQECCENGEVAVFVDINLYVRKDGEWSKPIHGSGGNKLISIENKWIDGKQVPTQYLDDDAYKKAYTDAISVAAKALGIGADVYWQDDKTKYDSGATEETAEPQVQSVPVRKISTPLLAPDQPMWRQAVAFTASQTDTVDHIISRIRSKYQISDNDLALLLQLAGKNR